MLNEKYLVSVQEKDINMYNLMLADISLLYGMVIMAILSAQHL